MILAIADQPVAGVDDLHRYLTAARIGVPTSLTILRRTARRRLTVIPVDSQR